VLNDALSIYFGDATLASALSPVGVPVPRSRPLVACFGCGKMSRSR